MVFKGKQFSLIPKETYWPLVKHLDVVKTKASYRQSRQLA